MESVTEILESRLSHCVSFTQERSFLAGPDNRHEDKASTRYKQEEIISYKQIVLLTVALQRVIQTTETISFK
jgi:hypothetical protein